MSCDCLRCEIVEQPHITLCFVTDGGGRWPPYEGPYEVIPKTVDQTLQTKQKSMVDDVTVKEIPYVEVSNIFGTTVSIATE